MPKSSIRIGHGGPGEMRLPRRDPKRPPFRPDRNFRPLCYEFRVTVSRPEWLWSDKELRECNLPREEPGLFLSYRESGRAHTIVWCHAKQWCQWQGVALFGDAPPSGGLDRSKIDKWSHRDFCMLLAAEYLRDDGHYIDFPSDDFHPVPRFSPHALDVWTAVDSLGEDGKTIFGEGFTPSKNAGGLH